MTITACSDPSASQHDSGYSKDQKIAAYEDSLSFSLQETAVSSNSEQSNGVTFGVKVISAEQFLSRTGAEVSEEDQQELSQETVVLLEIALQDPGKDILESPRLLFSGDDVARYLSGMAQQDIKVEQDGKVFAANGVSYEGKVAGNNRLRLLCFFKGIDGGKPATIQYYDRLFGLGIMKFNIQGNQDI